MGFFWIFASQRCRLVNFLFEKLAHAGVQNQRIPADILVIVVNFCEYTASDLDSCPFFKLFDVVDVPVPLLFKGRVLDAVDLGCSRMLGKDVRQFYYLLTSDKIAKFPVDFKELCEKTCLQSWPLNSIVECKKKKHLSKQPQWSLSITFRRDVEKWGNGSPESSYMEQWKFSGFQLFHCDKGIIDKWEAQIKVFLNTPPFLKLFRVADIPVPSLLSLPKKVRPRHFYFLLTSDKIAQFTNAQGKKNYNLFLDLLTSDKIHLPISDKIKIAQFSDPKKKKKYEEFLDNLPFPKEDVKSYVESWPLSSIKACERDRYDISTGQYALSITLPQKKDFMGFQLLHPDEAIINEWETQIKKGMVPPESLYNMGVKKIVDMKNYIRKKKGRVKVKSVTESKPLILNEENKQTHTKKKNRKPLANISNTCI